MDTVKKLKKAREYLNSAENLIQSAINENPSLARRYGSDLIGITQQLHKYGQGVDFQDKYLPSITEILEHEGEEWHNDIGEE